MALRALVLLDWQSPYDTGCRHMPKHSATTLGPKIRYPLYHGCFALVRRWLRNNGAAEDPQQPHPGGRLMGMFGCARDRGVFLLMMLVLWHIWRGCSCCISAAAAAAAPCTMHWAVMKHYPCRGPWSQWRELTNNQSPFVCIHPPLHQQCATGGKFSC
jgi:hypothetical protein